MPISKATIDDGFNPELVKGAHFDGIFEIPLLRAPERIEIPEGFTPFAKRSKKLTENEALSFFEFDTKFANVLIKPEIYVETVKSFPFFVPPDCSLYRDQPFAVQVANVYRSRAIGHFFQRQEANVYPLVRWGDERTYTDVCFSEPVSFAGVEKNSVVVVSTYGCIRGIENRRHFSAGLTSMIDTLAPQVVLVHGAMPKSVFGDVRSKTDFIQFPDWTTRVKGRY